MSSIKCFKTAEEYENKFLEYIEYCNETNKKMPNIAGFCRFCKINRDSFYQTKEYYPESANYIENILEDETINSKLNDVFKIFYLKNKFGYKDKTETENINHNTENYKTLTVEELKKLAEENK